MRISLALLSLPMLLSVACGDDSSPGSGSNGGGAGVAQGGAMSGGGATSGSGGGGKPAGSGGAMGGASAGNASTAGQGGAAGGVAGSGGTSGMTSSGSGGGGGSTAGGCTRELLKTTIDAYFKALASHSPTGLPLADTVKFTENGKASKLGEAGLWKTAGALKYSHTAYDTETCMSASQAVIPDGTTDVPVAVRLKLQDQRLTEVETIVARADDYPALAANTAALAASDDIVKWEQAVPADQRAKHEELTAWIENYFVRFPQGVCNVTSDCKRIENGGGTFTCGGLGATCATGPAPSTPVMTGRLVMADVETGLGVGFTMFQGDYIDMHMFKMYGGKVYAVSAILANADSSGWD
jgi:hypothetical protein